MSVYVIAMKNREFLDTPVFHAGPSGNDEAVAVFNNRESAQQYIDEAGWSDHEDGTPFLAVNPGSAGTTRQ